MACISLLIVLKFEVYSVRDDALLYALIFWEMGPGNESKSVIHLLELVTTPFTAKILWQATSDEAMDGSGNGDGCLAPLAITVLPMVGTADGLMSGERANKPPSHTHG